MAVLLRVNCLLFLNEDEGWLGFYEDTFQTNKLYKLNPIRLPKHKGFNQQCIHTMLEIVLCVAVYK